MIIKAGSIIVGGQVVSILGSLVRNIVIARSLGVEQFGVASTLALLMALVEMVGNLAIDRAIVQYKDGNSREVLGCAHLLTFIRNSIISVLLFFASTSIAIFFNIPESAWAFQVVALSPFIRGFINYDHICKQRDFNFNHTALITALPILLTSVLAYPLCKILQDYTAMVYIILLQATIQVGLSHLLSAKRYFWHYELSIFKRLLEFGWPLLLNGLLMFVIFNGDKIIVGSNFSMETLGWYGAALTIATTPTLFMAKSTDSLFLPYLSKSQSNFKEFGERASFVFSLGLLASVPILAILVVAGPTMLILLFGEGYEAGVHVLIWLAIAQGLRSLKISPAVIATATANTRVPMYTNMTRLSGVLLACLFAYLKFDMIMIAAAGVFGELCSLVTAIYFLFWQSKRPFTIKFSRLLVCLISVSFLMLAIFGSTHEYKAEPFVYLLSALGLSIAYLSACFFFPSKIKEQAMIFINGGH